MNDFYGYVLKEEFLKHYGKEKARELLTEIFNKLGGIEGWELENFIYISFRESHTFHDGVWFVDNRSKFEKSHLSGWIESEIKKIGYYKVSPEQFVNVLLGEDMNKEVKVAKPRFHKKRKPVPVRKKTDITVYYSTGEKYTLKNVKALYVKGENVNVGLTPEAKNGYFEGKVVYFSTGNVDSFLVKTPKGNYTLDSVGDGEFILTQEGSVLTLTELNQVF
ncbi:MAG: hypothetical protein KGZ89_06755 [Actinobacteria bacterium]|nr:hypothetical protein [Actinomycetota bacterium]